MVPGRPQAVVLCFQRCEGRVARLQGERRIARAEPRLEEAAIREGVGVVQRLRAVDPENRINLEIISFLLVHARAQLVEEALRERGGGRR